MYKVYRKSPTKFKRSPILFLMKQTVLIVFVKKQIQCIHRDIFLKVTKEQKLTKERMQKIERET